MQRQSTCTVVCVVAVFIVLAAAVAILRVRDPNNSNSILLTDSSSTDSAAHQFNISLLLDHNTSIIAYPWTLSGDSSNKTNNTNKEATNNHDGQNSNFISITNIAQGRYITPIKSTRSSNKCTDNNKSLMRFTLITDNYPVRFVCSLVCVHMMCSYAMCSFC